MIARVQNHGLFLNGGPLRSGGLEEPESEVSVGALCLGPVGLLGLGQPSGNELTLILPAGMNCYYPHLTPVSLA